MPSLASRRSTGIVSVGYEGRTADALIDCLQSHRVTVLADVRLTPSSRKPGLSKSRLGISLFDAGIRYLHLRPLGNPKENRLPFWNGDVETGCQIFRDRMLREPESQRALDELRVLAASERVAILCFERDHERCHRQVVIDELGYDRLEDVTIV